MYQLDQRFDLTAGDKAGIEAFKTWLWRSSEVCNHCFTRVRSIGEVHSAEMWHHTHEIKKHYERTEQGSQEAHPFQLPSARYGTTFCTECGRDCSAGENTVPFEDLKRYAVNIHRYTAEHTPLSLDHEQFGREAARLKRQPEHQGRGRAILAVAFARALDSEARPTASSPTNADEMARTDGGC